MSFAEQERALFDLLFDPALRECFRKSSDNALRGYALSDEERADFTGINAEALEMDAYMRVDFLLSHLCRAFPLSFSLASSLPGGLDLLRQLIDTRTMHTPPDERTPAFGARLRQLLVASPFSSAAEQAAVVAIAEVELGMAMTAGALRRTLTAGGSAPPAPPTLPADWPDQPVHMAAYVSAALIPRSYPQLQHALCPCPDAELWTHLSGAPMSASVRTAALAQQTPRLLLAQARVTHLSACDVNIEHATLELSDGFAPLFAHVNGTTSVAGILGEMRRVGAVEGVLQGIQSAFRQLLVAGFVVTLHTT
jgi:hypothetical protein